MANTRAPVASRGTPSTSSDLIADLNEHNIIPLIKRRRLTRSTYGSVAEIPIVLDSSSSSSDEDDSDSDSGSDGTTSDSRAKNGNSDIKAMESEIGRHTTRATTTSNKRKNEPTNLPSVTVTTPQRQPISARFFSSNSISKTTSLSREKLISRVSAHNTDDKPISDTQTLQNGKGVAKSAGLGNSGSNKKSKSEEATKKDGNVKNTNVSNTGIDSNHNRNSNKINTTVEKLPVNTNSATNNSRKVDLNLKLDLDTVLKGDRLLKRSQKTANVNTHPRNGQEQSNPMEREKPEAKSTNRAKTINELLNKNPPYSSSTKTSSTTPSTSPLPPPTKSKIQQKPLKVDTVKAGHDYPASKTKKKEAEPALQKKESNIEIDYDSIKVRRDVYNTCCISCKKNGRAQYCNKQKPCDICVGKKLRHCSYSDNAKVIIQGKDLPRNVDGKLKKLVLTQQRLPLVRKDLDRSQSKGGILAVPSGVPKNVSEPIKPLGLLHSIKPSKIPQIRNVDIVEKIARQNTTQATQAMVQNSSKSGEKSTKEDDHKAPFGETDKSDDADEYSSEADVEEEDDDADADEDEDDDEDDNTNDFESEDDEYDEHEEERRRKRRGSRSRAKERKSTTPADEFSRAERMLRELEFEKRDMNDIFTTRRRRAATKENYYIPSDVDEEEDLDNGYAMAEARNEQVILSEDEEERRMLRGDIDMSYLQSLRLEREKQAQHESSDSLSSDEDIEL